ncbi:protein of unknown function (plasmid) [Vibrio harveyi]|nr:protein of unknown function [Vibrio harveyi]
MGVTIFVHMNEPDIFFISSNRYPWELITNRTAINGVIREVKLRCCSCCYIMFDNIMTSLCSRAVQIK